MSTMRAAMLGYTKRRIDALGPVVATTFVDTFVALADGRSEDALRHYAEYSLRISALSALCLAHSLLAGDP